MDLCTHFYEIKLLATLAIGYLCYRTLPKEPTPSQDWEFSDEESMNEESVHHPAARESIQKQESVPVQGPQSEFLELSQEIPASSDEMNPENSEDIIGIKEIMETRSISKETIRIKRRYVPKKRSSQAKDRKLKTKGIKKEKKTLITTH